MFYEETQINEHLICPYCKNKYNDPRVMKCGASFCLACINLMIKTAENGFKCPVCEDFHKIPKTGYSMNLNLAKLCKIKANEVSRSPLADSLKPKLDEIKLKLDELSKENSLGADKIKDYCAGLRNEVQLSSEQLIEGIKTQNMELIEQINAYEKSSMLDFNEESQIQLNNFIQEKHGIHTKWIDYLKQFKLDDKDLKTAWNEANKCLEQINQENQRFLFKLFNENLLKFNRNSSPTNSSILGSLIKTDIQQNNSENVINLYPHYLPDCFNFNKEEPLLAKLLNDDKLMVAYRKSDCKEIKLAVFDNNLNVLYQKDCITGRNFKNFLPTVMINNSIVLCLINPIEKLNNYNNKSDDEDYREDFTNTESIIKKFDNKLKKLKKTCLNFVVSSMDTYDNKLYCMTRSSYPVIYLYVLDDNLVNLMKIGQSNTNEPFYIECINPQLATHLF